MLYLGTLGRVAIPEVGVRVHQTEIRGIDAGNDKLIDAVSHIHPTQTIAKKVRWCEGKNKLQFHKSWI